MARDTSNATASFTDFAETAIKDVNGNDLASPTTPIAQNLYVLSADVKNNSGSDSVVGWGYLLSTDDWKAGQWDDSDTGSEYTDDTTDAQDAGTDDFAITTTTNNDGCIIQFDHKGRGNCIVIGFDISTAEVGSPVYEYSYWSGSAYTTITPLVSPDFTSTGKTALVLPLPNDAADGAEDSDKVAVRIRATTAPSTAPLATSIWVSNLLDWVGSLSSGSSLYIEKNGLSQGMKVFPGYKVVAYCENSDARNSVSIDYSYGF